MENETNKNGKSTKDDKLISLVILTSDGAKKWEADFEKTTKVSELITATINHFKLATDGRYELRLKGNMGEALQPDRPLVSYQMVDGDILVFTDYGKGV